VSVVRRSPSFATRLVAVQFAVVGALVLLSAGVAIWLTSERVNEQAEQRALGIAQALASDPGLRAEVAALAAADTLNPAVLAAGPVQARAEAVRERTGALFVVVTEDRGLRLAHPNPGLIGLPVSTEPTALQGIESVSREHGTLGESVRAKVPVLAPGGGAVVGEVSIGLGVTALAAQTGQAVTAVLLIGAAALLLAGTAAALLVRRLRRITLGLGPADMAQLARDQDAVLYGVEDGVIGIGPDGRISLRNKAARRLLGLPHRTDPEDIVGRPYAEAGLPTPLVAAIAAGTAGPLRLAAGERVLQAGVREVIRDGQPLGQVVLLRDQTAVEALGSRLDAVETMAAALRVQRHEFANRLHTISGLLANGDVEAAHSYVGEVIDSGPVRQPVANLAAVRDTYLGAFLGAKGVQAYELGVALRVGEDTALYGSVRDPQDATAVLGNLLDNALQAAVRGPGPQWVEVDLLSVGDTLHLAVADSGEGIAPGLDVFAEGATTRPGDADAAQGHGLGLALARRLARGLGGEVWIADPGGGGHGAVFAALLPGVLEPDAAPRQEEENR
jgi:two-component system CitB family sensor kinase